MRKTNPTRHRPMTITLVAMLDLLTGIVVTVLVLLAGFALLTMPLVDPRNNLLCTRIFGFVCIPAGLMGGATMLWRAWNIYNLNPLTYRMLKADAWRPQYRLVTRFGRRLDDEDVLAAFGIDAEKDDSKKPNDS